MTITRIMRPLSFFVLAYSMSHATNNAGKRPFFHGALGTVSSTESLSQIPIPFSIVVNFHRLNVNTNTKDGNTIYAFRDDTVSFLSITVGAGLTGQFALDNANVIVLAESLCNVLTDTTLSTAGSISSTGYFWCVKR